MNTNSVEKLNNGYELNLNKTFNWFNTNFVEALNAAMQEFWDSSFDFKLISVSENENILLSGSEYFVTRIKLTKEHKFVIRLSKEAVKLLLDNALGEKSNFQFEKITELEAKILTTFNNFVFSSFEGKLLKKEDINDNQGECHLTFYIKNNNDELAKLIITIPNAFLNCEETVPAEDKFGIEDFPTAKVAVNLYIGSTSLPLNDIKNLEKEDIIVLEDSNINNMTLSFGGNEIGFKVSPDPSLIISFDNNDGSKDMSKAGNIWDNIQVDISAEFEKIKISLGEIKQIDEGLVVDMGSVYDNKVNLKVEDKTIAKGELVIINDRYGIRIDEVLQENQSQAVEQPQAKPESQPKAEPPVEENAQQPASQDEANSEEFDYKDFDVEDENI